MLRILLVAVAMLLVTSSSLGAPQDVGRTVVLWPDGAPGALGNEDADKPSLTIFPASGEGKVPTTVIVFPGGGYSHLSFDNEGTNVAAWLNRLGITAFVLKYRLGPKYHHPIELGDAQRAIRYVRAHAAEYEYDANRIGVWGFSAGGHLAATAGTHFDAGKPDAADPIERLSSRPDFMILAYPVITFVEPYVHTGSRDSLLGENPDPALVALLSDETQVTAQTPPTFLFHTSEDATVPVQNSVMFYLALRKAGVPAEMHIFEKGQHGVGLAQDDPALKAWPELLAAWLKVRGLR
jgi:acetyl esterase/lipase